LKAVPDLDPVVRENRAAVIVFTGAVSDWNDPNIVISWGTHHHQPRVYPDHIKGFPAPDGLLSRGMNFARNIIYVSEKLKILKNPVPESEPAPFGFLGEALTNKRRSRTRSVRLMSRRVYDAGAAMW